MKRSRPEFGTNRDDVLLGNRLRDGYVSYRQGKQFFMCAGETRNIV